MIYETEIIKMNFTYTQVKPRTPILWFVWNLNFREKNFVDFFIKSSSNSDKGIKNQFTYIYIISFQIISEIKLFAKLLYLKFYNIL